MDKFITRNIKPRKNYFSKYCDNNTIEYEPKSFYAYTDGSTFNNHLKEEKRFGGVGVYFPDEKLNNISLMLKNCKISNNVAELTAIKLAIETIINSDFVFNDNIYIYTDSKYSIDCFEKYCKIWQKNNWTKGKSNGQIKNLDLIKNIWNYCNKYKIVFNHVNSHQAEPKDKGTKDYQIWFGNFMADKLAVNASKQSLIESKNETN